MSQSRHLCIVLACFNTQWFYHFSKLHYWTDSLVNRKPLVLFDSRSALPSAEPAVNVADVNICSMKSSLFSVNVLLFVHTEPRIPEVLSQKKLSTFNLQEWTRICPSLSVCSWMATAAEEPPGLQGPSGCKYCIIMCNPTFSNQMGLT